MKENPNSIAREAAEAAGIGFDCLDAGVEALADGIGDRMQGVGQKIGQMPVQYFGDGLPSVEVAAHDTAFSLGEKVRAVRGTGRRCTR